MKSIKREPWMGARRRGVQTAVEQRRANIERLAGQKAEPMLRLQHRLGYAVVADGSQWDRVLDQMPRKPYKFLAMVAEIERKRTVAKALEEKRAKRRERYLKRFSRDQQPRPATGG